MDKFFVIWSDYDSIQVDEFEEQKLAEKLCSDILSKQELGEYGTRLHNVIEGNKLEAQRIEIVSKVKFIR